MDRRKDPENAPLQVWINRRLKGQFDGYCSLRDMTASEMFEKMVEFYLNHHKTK